LCNDLKQIVEKVQAHELDNEDSAFSQEISASQAEKVKAQPAAHKGKGKAKGKALTFSISVMNPVKPMLAK